MELAMPYADKKKRDEYNKKYRKEYYAKNKERVTKRVYARKRQKIQDYRDYKASLECERCGYSEHPDALDFHHVVKHPDNERVNVLIRNGYFNRANNEMNKCVVLCSNCHRRHHALND
jgi:hypothetical protein